MILSATLIPLILVGWGVVEAVEVEAAEAQDRSQLQKP